MSLLTDRCFTGPDFVYFFQEWALLRLRVTCHTERHTQKLGHHIVRNVSKFRRST